MTADINPYQSPSSIDAGNSSTSGSPGRIDRVAFITWPIVFGLNMIVPLLFGLAITYEHGRIGLCVASGLLLAGGWLLCYASPPAARRLIVGSAVFAFTQFFPIIQLIAGMIAISVTGSEGGFDEGPVVTEFTGFAMTLVVGTILLAFAGGLGVLLGFVLPRRWFNPDAPDFRKSGSEAVQIGGP